MAYKQSFGRSPLEKTGRGMGPILQKIAGTDAQQKATPNFFSQKLEESKKYSQAPDFIGNIRKEEAADKELRANAAFSGDSEKIAQYDRLAKNNSLAVKNDFGAATLYGKGSAKAGDTSAEVITLKQNQGQLPGEKGFTGGVDRQGTTIFPNIKGDKVTGQIPMESQMSGETYAGNTSKTYYKSDKPGTLGKLETLASGRTGDKSKSAIAESFGLMDQFNQTMGGKRNAARIGRDDKEYANYLLNVVEPPKEGEKIKERANVLSGSGTKADTDYSRRMMDLQTSRDKTLSFKKAKSFAGQEGQNALYKNDTERLVNLATKGGKMDEDAIGYLQANIGKQADMTPSKGGYESTYKQKYDYPTNIDFNRTKNAQGETEIGRNTYSGPKGGSYFSPKSTFAQNTAAAAAADSNIGLKDFLTKGKSYFKR